MVMVSVSIPTTPIEDPKLCVAPNLTQQTSAETLAAIYAAHYGYVLQVCRRFFPQREDAEDAAAEVFLKLHHVLDKKDETLPFRPWVSRVAGRHCIDKLRQRRSEKRSCVSGMDVSWVPDRATPSPLSQVLLKEEHRHIREQLIRLPRRYKVPLVLRYYRCMSYSRIGRVLDRQLPSVRTLIFRAKSKLRRNLESFNPAANTGLLHN